MERFLVSGISIFMLTLYDSIVASASHSFEHSAYDKSLIACHIICMHTGAYIVLDLIKGLEIE